MFPELSMTSAPVKETWPKFDRGTSLQNSRLHDDGASATTSADERAKPLAVCVVEKVQPCVHVLLGEVEASCPKGSRPPTR